MRKALVSAKHHQTDEMTNETMSNKGNKMEKCTKCGKEQVVVEWVPEGSKAMRDYPRYQSDIGVFIEDIVEGTTIAALAKKEFLLCSCGACGYVYLADTKDNV